jgi:hypothetical protein
LRFQAGLTLAVALVATVGFAASENDATLAFARSIRLLPALETHRVKNPHLDYLSKNVEQSRSDSTSALEKIRLIEAAEENLKSRNIWLDTASPISVQATTQLGELYVRNLKIFVTLRAALPKVGRIVEEAKVLETNLKLAEIVLKTSRAAASARETNDQNSEIERLEALKALQTSSLNLNKKSLAETKLKLAKVYQEDLEFERSNPSEEMRDRMMLNRLIKRIDEVSAGKYAPSGLNDLDRLAISLYTEGAYLNINEAQWASKAAVYNDFTDQLNHALFKLPAFTGVVHRKTRLTPEQLADYQTNHEITMPAYIMAILLLLRSTSSSARSRVATSRSSRIT